MSTLRSSRGRGRGNVNQGRGGAPLKGWDFIQEKALSHDEDMIADYADDIDTLLVFAGLFSAVLTAFLVVSLVLLQPDNSQATVQILSVIALRIGAPSDIQPFLNETAESLPMSTTFKAPTSVATINTLWFTSLVLSLAAALFGILAKQWCREYLRWHSVIATARENVLIRQVRFEAWDRWQVGAFIAFIPAFLEIALILFLVGVPIFARTFSELALTVVVSVVVAFMLMGVVVLTVLPVFSRLCPFQTPTGWAFVRLAGLLHQALWQFARWTAVLCDRSLRHANVRAIRHQIHHSLESTGWQCRVWLRSTDTLLRVADLKNWRAYGLYSVKSPELCKIVPAASDIKQACRDMRTDFDEASVDAVQTSTLFRALTWVRLGSNDETVLTAIREAVPTIHATISTADAVERAEKPHFLSAIHAICPTDVSGVLNLVRKHFYSSSEGWLYFRGGPQLTFGIYNLCGPFIHTYKLMEEDLAACEAWTSNSVSLEVSHVLIRSDLSSLIDDWLSLLPTSLSQYRQGVAERIASLLCVVRILPSDDTHTAAEEAGPNLTLPLAELLEEIYRKLAPHKAAYEDGLVSLCVEMCRLLGPVTFKLDREQGDMNGIHIDTDSLFDLKFSPSSSPNVEYISTWATLAVDIYRNTSCYEDSNKRHLFVTSVSHVFEALRLRIDSALPSLDGEEKITPVVELLSCMVDALRWSLACPHLDCGAYISLPWVKDVMQCYQAANVTRERLHNVNPGAGRRRGRETYREPLSAVPLTGHVALRPTFLLIVRLMEACLHHRLLTGETTAADFEQLLRLLEYPKLPDVPADLTLASLEAHDRGVSAKPHYLNGSETADVHDSLDEKKSFGARTEQPLVVSTSSPTTQHSDIPQFTHPPSASLRLADSDISSPSSQREPALEDTHTAADFSSMQTVSGLEPATIVDPCARDHDADRMLRQKSPASDSDEQLARLPQDENEICSLHTLTPSRTPTDTSANPRMRSQAVAGISQRGDICQGVGERGSHNGNYPSTASPSILALEIRAGDDTLVARTDDRDRDLEAALRNPSSVDEDRGEV